MDVIEAAKVLRARAASGRGTHRTIGFVPTMGFFHEGHRSLMRAARGERDMVIVSIFVNPLQFGPREDFASYPRDMDRDLALAAEEGVDAVFVPPVGEMYPSGDPDVTVDPGILGLRFEGATRPGHFRGVATVVAKLFQLVGSCRAYFGEKDAQQLAIIRRMVRDLGFPVDVVGCPTVREPDGLALSSRNVYLSPEERSAATCLYRALETAADIVGHGERDARVVRKEMAGQIQAEPLAELDYAAIVDEGSFAEVQELVRPARALIAARVGPARLIDNVLLPVRHNGDEEGV
ncbi:MAG: pantoate--beta-alanine ligase [Actinomycetota bacterium]